MSAKIVRLLALDSFGTVFDVQRGLPPALAAASVENPAEFAASWIRQTRNLTQAVNASGQFQPFDELVSRALEETATERRIELTAAQRARFKAAWRRLPTFEDVKNALQTWRDSSALAWIVTNGDLDTVQELLVANEIGGLINGVYSAAAAEVYKPSRAIYAGAAAAAGVLPAQIVMASGLASDVDGAKAAGMHAAWIRRDPSASAPQNPDWIVNDLQDLIPILQPLLPRPNPGERAV